MQELRKNYNGINVSYLKSEIIRLANLNGLEHAKLYKLRLKSEIITEYERIFLASSIKSEPNSVPEEVVYLTKKEAIKALKQANKTVKSISGLIRLLKEFTEFHPILKTYGIDINKLSPKYIKGLWKSEYVIDGKICEQYRKKNPLYSETDDIEAQKQGIKYEIPTHVDDIREVENFTPNKLIKYCGK